MHNAIVIQLTPYIVRNVILTSVKVQAPFLDEIEPETFAAEKYDINYLAFSNPSPGKRDTG